MTRKQYRLLLLMAVGVSMLSGIATFAASAPVTSEATRIAVKDFMFAPNTLKVKAGSTVTWINMDDEPHAVLSDTKMFRSGALDTNESFSFRFEKPGTYHFACSIHPRMVGTIVVEPTP